MIRLLGVTLPKHKKIEYALTYIYGIGLTNAKKIASNSKINPNKRVSELTTLEIKLLRNNLGTSTLLLEGHLRRFHGLNIKHLLDINCYKGIRHRIKLPVRGQRTHTNARLRNPRKRKKK